MGPRPLIIIVRASQELDALLDKVARNLGHGVARIPGYLGIGKCDLSALPQDAPCVALIDFTVDFEQARRTAEILAAHSAPRIYPVAISSNRDSTAILSALRSGCIEFLDWPTDEDLMIRALTNVTGRIYADSENAPLHGQVTVFLGVRGGVGATTLAVHLALALKADPTQSILIADMHKLLGHVALYLGVTNSGFSFHDMVANCHRLDATLFCSMLAETSTGVSVLCSPDDLTSMKSQLDEAQWTGRGGVPSAVDMILALMRANFTHTIIDADPCTPEGLLIAQKADRIYYVASLDIASMRDVSRVADQIGRSGETQKLVLTRANHGVLTPEILTNRAELPLAVRFPDLTEPITGAINAGKPISRNVNQFYERLDVLVRDVTGSPSDAKTRKRAGQSWRLW